MEAFLVDEELLEIVNGGINVFRTIFSCIGFFKSLIFSLT